MKLKINKSPIYNILIFTAIMECGIFQLFSVPILGNETFAKMTVIALSVLLFVNCVINRQITSTLKPYTGILYPMMFVLFLFIAVVSIYSVNEYNQGIIPLFNCFRDYFYILLIFPLLFIFEKSEKYENFLKALVVMFIISISFRFFRAVIYNYTGRIFLHGISSSIRYGRMRSAATAFFGVAAPYIIYKTMEEKDSLKKIGWFALTAFTYLYIFYTNMTRMHMIALILVTVVIFLLKKRPKTKQIIVWFIGISIIIIAVYSGTFTLLIDSLSETNKETGASTIARQIAIEYFTTYTKKNPVFSMGFVCPTTMYFKKIFFGPTLTSCYDDLGIINMWYHHGITGIIFIAPFVIRIVYLTIKICFFSNSDRKLFIGGLFTYIASTQVSLSIFDPQRLFMFVTMWAVMEYENRHSTVIQKREIIKFYRPKSNELDGSIK